MKHFPGWGTMYGSDKAAIKRRIQHVQQTETPAQARLDSTGSYEAWRYNTIPLPDREWMKEESKKTLEALYRSITGGSKPEED